MKKRFISLLLALMLLFIPTGCNAAGEEGAQPSAALTLEISGGKNSFTLGEAFSAEGLTVKVTDAAGNYTALTSDEYTLDHSAYNKNVAGTYFIRATAKAGGQSGAYSVSVQKPGPAAAWTYKSFKAEYPDYPHPEEKFNADRKSGLLNRQLPKTRALIQEGVSDGLNLISGTASTGASDGALITGNAIMEIHESLLLPFTSDGRWEINFSAKLFGEAGFGGALFNSDPLAENRRVLLSADANRNVVFFGMNINNYSFNYCWAVDSAVLRQKAAYAVAFDGRELKLSVNGGAARGLDHLIIGQDESTLTAITDNAAATKEIVQKIKMLRGQPYVSFTHIGAGGGQGCSGAFYKMRAAVSAMFGYAPVKGRALEGKSLYFVGSSVFAGWTTDLLAENTGATVSKTAVRGTRLSGSCTTVNDAYVSRMLTLDWSKQPDVAVIQLSVNDFGANVSDGGVAAVYGAVTGETDLTVLAPKTGNSITAGIEYMVSYIRQNSPRSKILFITAPIYDYSPAPGTWAGRDKAYKPYVAYLKESVAPAYHFSVLDLFSETGYVNLTNGKYHNDSLHMNGLGYAGVFDPYLTEAVRGLLESD